jgi:malate synthase
LAGTDTATTVSEAGLRHDLDVAVRNIAAWLRGAGRVRIDDRLEDAAGAELSRARVRQWIRHGRVLDDGRGVTASLCRGLIARGLRRLHQRLGDDGFAAGRYEEAAAIVERLLDRDDLALRMTEEAYDRLG